MKSEESIIFVSAGMEKPKKRDYIISRRQQYLNYGALSLVSLLSTRGYKIKLFHGEYIPPKEFFEKIIIEGYEVTKKYPLLISIPSFYALSWTQKFTKIVKEAYPEVEIIVGGRWVVGSDIEWLKELLAYVDSIVPGLAEDKIEGIINGSKTIDLLPWATEKSPLFNLNHRLVYEYRKYQPSVEASRGCGMKCLFCEERSIPLTSLKKPELLASHFQELVAQYNDDTIRPYVQSSFFAPNVKWSENLADEIERLNINLSWRCESRVDSIKPNMVASLAAAGLKVIDLGLESASETQILRMNKSRNPNQYLKSASDLINACKKYGIWVKLNFLIYAGETTKTFDETIKWLDEHENSIKGISVGPVVVFGSPRTASGFISSIISAGGRLVDKDSNRHTGIGYIHPSFQISNLDAEDLSIFASRRYMTDLDYFDLKSFSYYPRNYTRSDFENDIKMSDKKVLPFRLR